MLHSSKMFYKKDGALQGVLYIFSVYHFYYLYLYVHVVNSIKYQLIFCVSFCTMKHKWMSTVACFHRFGVPLYLIVKAWYHMIPALQFRTCL